MARRKYQPIKKSSLDRLETVAMNYSAWRDYQDDDAALNVVLDRLELLERLMSETFEAVAKLGKAF